MQWKGLPWMDLRDRSTAHAERINDAYKQVLKRYTDESQPWMML